MIKDRIIYFGSIVESEFLGKYTAYNAAGDLFQERFLNSLKINGFIIDKIYSGRPVSSYPNGKLIYKYKNVTKGLLKISLLPFINYGPVKTFTLGVSSIIYGIFNKIKNPKRVSIYINYNLRFPHVIFLLLLSKITKVPIISIIADIWADTESKSILRRIDLWFQTWSIKRLDGIITLTDNIVADFAPEIPSFVMNGAITKEEFNIIDKYTNAINDDDHFTIMYAGGLSRLKIGLLLEAFSAIDEPHYRLLITGRGPLEKEIKELAKHDKRIEFKGFLENHEDVLALYKRVDLLVNTQLTNNKSAKYTFPSKLIEYMATGRPVIATNTAGVKNEFSEYIFIIENERTDCLANAIKNIETLSYNQKISIMKRNKKFILNNKIWENIGERISNFINNEVKN